MPIDTIRFTIPAETVVTVRGVPIKLIGYNEGETHPDNVSIAFGEMHTEPCREPISPSASLPQVIDMAGEDGGPSIASRMCGITPNLPPGMQEKIAQAMSGMGWQAGFGDAISGGTEPIAANAPSAAVRGPIRSLLAKRLIAAVVARGHTESQSAQAVDILESDRPLLRLFLEYDWAALIELVIRIISIL